MSERSALPGTAFRRLARAVALLGLSTVLTCALAALVTPAASAMPGTISDREEWVLASRAALSLWPLEAYRPTLRPESSRGGPRVGDAPYLDMLLPAQLSTMYEPLYASEKAKAHQEQVLQLKTLTLYDGFLEMVLSGDLPDSMKESAGRIGRCLARKALEARTSCPMEEPGERAAPEAPATWKLGLARASCGILQGKCWVRRSLFAAAYPELLKARNDPAVRALVERRFEELFPIRFLQEFRANVDSRRKDIASWVAPKLGAKELFQADAPLIQADGESAASAGIVVRMDGFALGLLADLAAARTGLADQANDGERAAGAAGLWSSVQRLILLSGFDAATFDGDRYDWGEPASAGSAPSVRSALVGGWSVFGISAAAARPRPLPGTRGPQIGFERWDWEQYAKLPLTAGSVTRILPHAFEIDSRGVPSWSGSASAEHRLGDMALLIEAASDFLLLTRPGEPLARHFGSREELSRLLDPESPVLFPREMRLLGYGVLAAVFRNLLHPDIALLEVQSQIEAGKGLGIRFFESHSLIGNRDERPVARTASLARLILAAVRLRELLQSDRELPLPNPSAMLHQLDSVIQIGALTLGADAQIPAGGFRAQLGSKDLSTLDLEASLLGLRAIQEAHLLSGMSVMRLNLAAGMKWLKAALEQGILQQDDWSAQDRVALWHWISLWDRARPEWRDLLPEGFAGRDWQELRHELESRLLEAAKGRTHLNR